MATVLLILAIVFFIVVMGVLKKVLDLLNDIDVRTELMYHTFLVEMYGKVCEIREWMKQMQEKEGKNG